MDLIVRKDSFSPGKEPSVISSLTDEHSDWGGTLSLCPGSSIDRPQLHVEPPLPNAHLDRKSACDLRKLPSLDLNVVDLDLDLDLDFNFDVLPRFDWDRPPVSNLEENKARSSKIENLHGQHAVISGEQSCITFSLQGNEFREMIPKAMLLRDRAMACNRRKDLLYLLMSYPPKPEADQADLLLLRDDFIKINQTIKRMEEIGFTSGKKMESNVKYLEYRLDKYGFHINLYYASLRLLPRCGLEEVLVKICGTEEQGRIIGSALRQIVYCFKEGEL